MSKQPELTAARTEAVVAAARLAAATDAVDAAAATALGINRTDLRILELMLTSGPTAAGALAIAAALSPAATTTAIQRLVAAGYLTRETDSGDRRRAVVALTAAATSLLHRVYGPIEQAGRRELARYSVAELAVIVDFLRRAERLQLDQAARVRDLRVDRVGP